MTDCDCDDENELNFKVDDIIRYYCIYSSQVIGEECKILKIYKDNNGNDKMTIKNLSDSKEYQADICCCMVPSKQKKVTDNNWIDKDGNHYNDAGIKL